jgi:DNA end-binding protein Ku
VDKLLAITVLNYETQLKKPASFEDEVADVAVTGEEVKLAKTLVEASTNDEFEMVGYKDAYTGRLMKYLETKAGKHRVAAKEQAEEEPAIINLMDALKKSLANEKQTAPVGKAKKAKKRVEGQREMLLPIAGSGSGSGKRAAKEVPKKAEKPVRAPASGVAWGSSSFADIATRPVSRARSMAARRTGSAYMS